MLEINTCRHHHHLSFKLPNPNVWRSSWIADGLPQQDAHQESRICRVESLSIPSEQKGQFVFLVWLRCLTVLSCLVFCWTRLRLLHNYCSSEESQHFQLAPSQHSMRKATHRVTRILKLRLTLGLGRFGHSMECILSQPSWLLTTACHSCFVSSGCRCHQRLSSHSTLSFCSIA